MPPLHVTHLSQYQCPDPDRQAQLQTLLRERLYEFCAICRALLKKSRRLLVPTATDAHGGSGMVRRMSDDVDEDGIQETPAATSKGGHAPPTVASSYVTWQSEMEKAFEALLDALIPRLLEGGVHTAVDKLRLR